jgi:signal transduction histidine kinase
MRLTVKFALWAGAALVAIAVVSTYVGARQEERALIAQMERHAGQLADLLAADTSQALFTFAVGDLENTVLAFARDPAVLLIEVRDRSGRVLRASGRRGEERGMAIATREVYAGPAVVGSVTLGLSTEAARTATRAAWQHLVVREVLALVVLFAILAYLVRRVVSRPLARIAEVMRHVADGRGDLTRRVEAPGGDEIGDLGRRFNQMADALQTSHEGLARRVAELDSFAYIVAHDLRTPLVTIRSFCEVLRSHAELDERGRWMLERVDANVLRMDRLIGDVLAFARVGREAQPAELVDVGKTVDAICAEMRSLIETRGAAVTVQAGAALWGPRGQIEHVFRNLISNAIKYAGDSRAPVVDISLREDGPMWECAVRDNGLGIDPVHHERIFEIFQRPNTVDVDGTGVGLALVKKVVDNAGGRIWVDSRRGEGATFYFTWPKGPGDPR